GTDLETDDSLRELPRVSRRVAPGVRLRSSRLLGLALATRTRLLLRLRLALLRRLRLLRLPLERDLLLEERRLRPGRRERRQLGGGHGRMDPGRRGRRRSGHGDR